MSKYYVFGKRSTLDKFLHNLAKLKNISNLNLQYGCKFIINNNLCIIFELDDYLFKKEDILLASPKSLEIFVKFKYRNHEYKIIKRKGRASFEVLYKQFIIHNNNELILEPYDDLELYEMKIGGYNYG